MTEIEVTQEIIDESRMRFREGDKIECLMGWTGRSEEEDGIIREFQEVNLEEQSIWVRGSQYSLCIWSQGVWANKLDSEYDKMLKIIYTD